MIGTPGRVGLRINPEVEAGSIAATSVGTSKSRFGVPLERAFDSVIEAFRRRPWLGCLHVHVGSQGCKLEALTQGVAKVWRLRDVLHRAVGREQVDTIDIGGGLPAAYASLDAPPSFADYAGALRREVPGLFGDSVRLVTEFGRSIHAGCGFAASRVEYVKTTGEGRVAVVHLGADLLLRPAYGPEHWHHEFAVPDSAGTVKMGPLLPWTIAGPLCFAGDIIGHDLSLPEIRAGDYVLIRDVGAYAVSMWSRHCSRAMPLVLGYEDPVSDSSAPFTVLRSRERAVDIVKYWGP
jgi:diaminopimelate decarboxylase